MYYHTIEAAVATITIEGRNARVNAKTALSLVGEQPNSLTHHLHTSVYVQTNTHTYIHIRNRQNAKARAHTHTRARAHTHTHNTRLHTYTNKHIFKYIYTHSQTHSHELLREPNFSLHYLPPVRVRLEPALHTP